MRLWASSTVLARRDGFGSAVRGPPPKKGSSPKLRSGTASSCYPIHTLRSVRSCRKSVDVTTIYRQKDPTDFVDPVWNSTSSWLNPQNPVYPNHPMGRPRGARKRKRLRESMDPGKTRIPYRPRRRIYPSFSDFPDDDIMEIAKRKYPARSIITPSAGANDNAPLPFQEI